MERVTVSLDGDLLDQIDRLIGTRGYQNRSEAIRDLARAGLREAAPAPANGACVAALVYVYEHQQRDLPKRLLRTYHDNHDLTLATTHVHLDHSSCMELAVLRGRAAEVQHLADHIIAERGVRHGRLFTIPVTSNPGAHAHGGRPGHAHDHLHVEHGA